MAVSLSEPCDVIRVGKTVAVIFPAELVVDGQVKADEFPDWSEMLRGGRDA